MRSDVALNQRKPLLPFLAIAANWSIIAGCIAASIYAQSAAVTALAFLIIGARQHALFVVIHEAAHLHISRNKVLNDWTSDLFCAFPLLFDTGVYRENHLKHHRHLNTDRDPDWIRKHGRPQWLFPISWSQLLTFTPYFVCVFGALEWLYFSWRFSGLGSKQRWQTEPRFLVAKVAYFLTLGWTAVHLGIGQQILLYWFVPLFFVLPIIGRLRSVAEHFAVTYEDEYNSTRDVRTGWLEGFLLAPHNVNFHLTHHTYPHIPFYHLAKAHAQLSESVQFKGAHINSAYLLPYRDSVLRDILNGPRSKTHIEAATPSSQDSIKRSA